MQVHVRKYPGRPGPDLQICRKPRPGGACLDGAERVVASRVTEGDRYGLIQSWQTHRFSRVTEGHRWGNADTKNVANAQVLKGYGVVRDLERSEVDKEHAPLEECLISDCGALAADTDLEALPGFNSREV